jgi:hypothetical protein
MGEGGICEDCSSIFCSNHTRDGSCGVCDGKIISAKFTPGRLGDTSILYAVVGESAPIGLVGFDKTPKMLVSIAKQVPNRPGVPIVILLPNKKASYQVAESITPGTKEAVEKGLSFKPVEKSRYTILRSEKGENYFLLNTSALSVDSVKFLMAFVPNAISQAQWLMARKDLSIQKSMSTILFGYSNKFGIGFVHSNNLVMSLVALVEENMAKTYAEYLALKDTITADNLASAKEFCEYKLMINFENIVWRDIDYFLEVTKVLCMYVQSQMLVASANQWPGLHSALQSELSRHEANFRSRLEKHPDITVAVDSLKSNLESFDFGTGYAEAMEAIGAALEGAFAKLKPVYVWLSETIGLLQIGSFYQAGLARGGHPSNPEYGDYKSFLAFLKKIWERHDVYPEVPMVAIHISFELYREHLFRSFSVREFREVKEILAKFRARFEHDFAIIKKLNPNSAFRQADFVLPLLAFSKIARLHGLAKDESELIEVAAKFVSKHKLYDFQTVLAWHHYLRTFDPYFMGEIFRASSRLKKETYIEPQLDVMGDVARAIFDEKRAPQYLKQAEDAAMRILSPPTGPIVGYEVYMTASQMISSSATLLQVRMFEKLIESSNAPDLKSVVGLLTDAKRFAFLSGEELDPEDPFLNPNYMARILCHLARDEIREAEEVFAALRARMDDPSRLDRLKDLARTLNAEGAIVPKLATVARTKVEEGDVWTSSLLKVMRLKLDEQVQETLLGSEAVVFVEGGFDVTVFEAFARRLTPQLRLGFMDTGGWTNMSYYPTSRFAMDARLTMFCIFDGDTEIEPALARLKKKVVDRLKLPSDHVITLKRRAIEDYLFHPTALTGAFPSVGAEAIHDWISKLSKKRDKKSAIRLFMSEFGLGKYDAVTAAKLAANLEDEETLSEMKAIFGRLVSGNKA